MSNKPIVRLAVVANNINWASLEKEIQAMADWFATKLDIRVDLYHTDYKDIPFEQWRAGEYGIVPAWYTQALRPFLEHDICLFLVPTEQWQGGAVRGWQRPASVKAIELSIACREDGYVFIGGENAGSEIVSLGRHEIMHALFLMSGQPDTTHYWYGQNKLENALAEINIGRYDFLQSIRAQLRVLYEQLAKLIARQKMEIPKARYSANFLAWANAIKQYEGWAVGSRSYRNNNAGNLRFAGQKGAVAKDPQSFAIFGSYEEGWNALLLQLEIACTGKSRVYRPDMTIREFFAVYAPETDNNNPHAYASFVAFKIGVSPSTKIADLLK